MLSPTTYARTTACDGDRLLWQQHRARRDQASREALVERYLQLARHLARRYAGGGEEEDLVQVASLGSKGDRSVRPRARHRVLLLRSADDRPASSSATCAIHGWAVRVPRDVQELANRLGTVHAR